MKTRRLVSILIFVLAILLVIGSCVASRKTTIESESILSILTGTWINHDYDEKKGTAKVVNYPDGTFDLYHRVDADQPLWHGEFINIEAAWIDSEGTYWYRATIVESWFPDMPYNEIGKINAEKTVVKAVSSVAEFPSDWEWDPNHANYRIFYRQE